MHIEKQDRAFGGVEQRFLRGLQPHAGMQAAVELDEHRREVERWLSNSYPFHQIIFFVTTIVFLSWLYCASTNAWNMHALGMYFVPNTAVLSFFIPMLNLFWPYLVLQEIWRASHPLVRDTTHAWKNTVGLRLILAWWLCFVAGICLWVFRKPIGMEREILRGGERHIAEMFVLASHAIALVEGVMLVLIIRAISQRQTERHERLSA